jgi:hypothetical protein
LPPVKYASHHLEGHSEQARVLPLGGLAQLVRHPRVVALRRHLVEVDRRLERLDLAEEERALAVGVGPVVEESARDR